MADDEGGAIPADGLADDLFEPLGPPLPPGRTIEVPGLGPVFLRDVAGPPNAPVVVLLHGWTVTADLNWFACYEPLGRRFRVIAPDLRGHGRGPRVRPFTLEACADDLALLLPELGIEHAIVVGYSMGGTIAQLMWHRHPELVGGLVLCATAASFRQNRQEHLSFLGLSGLANLARLTPTPLRQWVADRYLARRADAIEAWALEEISRNDPAAVLEAGAAIGQFSSLDWIGELDVPAAVLLTMTDNVIPLRRQLELHHAMPDAVVFRIDGRHDVVARQPDQFVSALVQACTVVAERGRRAAQPR